MSKIFLCDGHNLAFRAFYGIRELNRSDGFPTNMIHGWLRSFWRLEDDFKPDDIWVFFDLGGCPQREKILPEYKANRGSPPEGFVEQLEWVKKLSLALGYGTGEAEGREADDLIAAKVEELKGATFTISSLSGIGGKFFTPIINPPEVGILGLSKTFEGLALENGDVKVNMILPMSLSYDHRVINGAYAAKFISKLSENLSYIDFKEIF